MDDARPPASPERADSEDGRGAIGENRCQPPLLPPSRPPDMLPFLATSRPLAIEHSLDERWLDDRSFIDERSFMDEVRLDERSFDNRSLDELLNDRPFNRQPPRSWSRRSADSGNVASS